MQALTNLMKNQNSRGHHIKRLETDQCLQETDIRIETFVKIDQVSHLLSCSPDPTINYETMYLLILNFERSYLN